MKSIDLKKLSILFLIILCGVVINLSQRFLSHTSGSLDEKESDLYLPEVSNLKFLSLGHDGLISDLVLAKALIYFGSHYHQRQTFTFKYLKKLFFTAIEMDPMNKDAFLMANNILSYKNIHHSLEVLKLGMTYHPRYWKFPEMIGFNYFYHLKDTHKAARYYEIASHLPDHPPYVPSLSGKLYQESGRYEDAVRVLNNFYSTTRDKRLKKSFKKSIEAIREKIRKKQFQVKATILKVINANIFEFSPDSENPQFKYLKPRETLRVVGIRPYEKSAREEKERLLAHLQKDYADFILRNASVKIEFERFSDGRIKRDLNNRFHGSIVLNNNKLYQLHVIENGIVSGNYNFPYREEYKKIFKEAEIQAREGEKGLYSFPPDEIELSEVQENTGKIVSLRFRVNRVEIGSQNILLLSSSRRRNIFNAVIPREYINNFSPTEDVNYFRTLRRKRIKVTGFVGVYNRQIQMKIYFPLQLETEG